MADARYRHYGWECSPYSGKTRAYLSYKQIPYEDIHPTFFTMNRVIKKRVGFLVMPVVIAPDGTVLQDTSDIIDHFEERFPEPGIVPEGPCQHLVSLLFELYADEWLPIISMHSRWNSPVNRAFAIQEFGACAFPWLPGFIQRRIGAQIAKKMWSYLPVLGITPETIPAIEAWTAELLDGLNLHFESQQFLLGERPCLGDFALYGPLYAHVRRDPGSSEMITSRPALDAWLERMKDPEEPKGEFLAGDRVPMTLVPILRRMFHEQGPILLETVNRVHTWLREHPGERKVPRGLGGLDFEIGGFQSTRRCLSFQQWMFQRPLSFYQSLSRQEREEMDTFLVGLGAVQVMQTEITRPLVRENFRVVAAKTLYVNS